MALMYLSNQRWGERSVDADGTLHFNGHTWPKGYQTRIKHTIQGRWRLACAHWADEGARFCPACGRYIDTEG